MYLASNLRFLRKAFGESQSTIAEKLGIPRTTLGDYERGHTQPELNLLLKLSKFYEIKIDDLLQIDLQKVDLNQFSNQNHRILALTMDSIEKPNIELVKTKAAAGYIDSFEDPEYLGELPKLSIPGLKGYFRAFEISGDSMLPMESGSILLCRYVENISDIKNGNGYILVTNKDGIVYKRLENIPEKQSIHCKSDNVQFPGFYLDYEDVKEIWSYQAHISFREPKQIYDELLDNRLSDIQIKLSELHKHYIGKK